MRYFQGTDITVGAGASVDTLVRAPQWAKRLIKVEYSAAAVGRMTVKSQTENMDIITNADFQRGTDNTYYLTDMPIRENDIFNVNIKNTSGGSIVYNVVFCWEDK